MAFAFASFAVLSSHAAQYSHRNYGFRPGRHQNRDMVLIDADKRLYADLFRHLQVRTSMLSNVEFERTYRIL